MFFLSFSELKNASITCSTKFNSNIGKFGNFLNFQILLIWGILNLKCCPKSILDIILIVNSFVDSVNFVNPQSKIITILMKLPLSKVAENRLKIAQHSDWSNFRAFFGILIFAKIIITMTSSDLFS